MRFGLSISTLEKLVEVMKSSKTSRYLKLKDSLAFRAVFHYFCQSGRIRV